MNERMRFVIRIEKGERMSELCREFGISRKTGYKLVNRYERWGPEGLFDVSRKPMHSPKQVAQEIEAIIIETRKAHPSWGPLKLRQYLETEKPGLCWPGKSSFARILVRNGLVKGKKKHRHPRSQGTPLAHATAPNRLWCADFKGQFRLGNGKYCYPLTITDAYSRLIIACEALEGTRYESARAVFTQAFRRYGLPHAIRTDNGPPFATRTLYSLSQLSVSWIRIGIRPERIQPGKPQQNGRHERMHRTLKQETTRPAGANFLQQQERFDSFVEEFNYKRPHQALEQQRPADLYLPSERIFCEDLEPLNYPFDDLTRVVYADGRLTLRDKKLFRLTPALAGETVGIREVEDQKWLVTYAGINLGWVDEQTLKFQPVAADGVLPMS